MELVSDVDYALVLLTSFSLDSRGIFPNGIKVLVDSDGS
jgi:hypothetical protein